VNYKEGTQSVKNTSDVGDEGEIQKINMALDGLGEKEIRFWMYIPDEDLVKAGSTYIELWDVNYADRLKYIYYYFEGWNLVRISPDDWDIKGIGTLNADINRMRLRHMGDPGVQGIISYDSLYFYQISEPAVVISFDDGHTTVFDTAYPIMRQRNMVATAYVVTDDIGGANKMTWAECVELQANGWTIGNHSEDHTDFTTLTEAEIETNLTNAVTAMQAGGITGNGPYHVAYPGGGYDADTLAAMADTNMLTGRTIEIARHPALPIDRPYEIPIWFDLDNGTSLATAKTRIDSLVAEGKIGYIYGHQIQAAAAATAWAESDFIELCNYIAHKRMATLTIEDCYQMQSGSRMIRKAR
jgi:peptidoglycan/xylan/chitin deacetylase (PgdA/CDA1 family)